MKLTLSSSGYLSLRKCHQNLNAKRIFSRPLMMEILSILKNGLLVRRKTSVTKTFLKTNIAQRKTTMSILIIGLRNSIFSASQNGKWGF